MFGLIVYTETPEGHCEREADEVVTMQALLDGMSNDGRSPLISDEDMKEVDLEYIGRNTIK